MASVSPTDNILMYSTGVLKHSVSQIISCIHKFIINNKKNYKWYLLKEEHIEKYVTFDIRFS